MVSPVAGDDVGGSGNLKSKSLFFSKTILLMYMDDPIPRIFKSRLLPDWRCRPAEGRLKNPSELYVRIDLE